MAFGGGFYEEFESLSLAARTASITATRFNSGPARGAIFTIYIKTAGTSTFNFRTSAINNIEDQGWVPTANVAMTLAGVYVVVVHPQVCMQPAGESADTTAAAVIQTVSIPAPAIWRPSIVKGDASSWTFGISVRRLR